MRSRRFAMNEKWLLLLVLLAAGCIDSAPIVATDSAADSWIKSIPVQEDHVLRYTSHCSVVSCEGGGSQPARVLIDANATVTSFNLTLDGPTQPEQGMHAVVMIDCEPGPRGCGNRLTQTASGRFPVQLVVTDLEFPPGVVLRLWAYLDGNFTPVVSTLTEQTVQARLTGTIGVRVDPNLVPTPPIIHELNINYDGYAGLCEVTIDHCGVLLGPQRAYAVNGSAIGIDVVATWAADTPLSDSLVLVFDCVRRAQACPEASFSVQGQSPLHLNVTDFQSADNIEYEVSVYVEGPIHQTGVPGQEYHIEGAVHYLEA